MVGSVVAGSIGAFGLLLLGIAVPLAGGTDFGGAPRVAGAYLAVIVWFVAVVAAGRSRQWRWLAALALLSPLWLLLYGTRVTEDFRYPEQWSAFASAPWYLIGLLLTPLLLLAWGALRIRREW